MKLSNLDLSTIRNRPQYNKLYLSVFSPRIILQAQVNNASIVKGQQTITFDNVTLGSHLVVEAGNLLVVGSTLGAKDIGRTRIKSITATQVIVAENSDIEWADNQFITIYRFFPILPVYPRIISDPSNINDVIFYKDYDLAYTNQNTVLGTFINMGSHRATFIENGSAQLWYTSSGTYNLVTGTTLSYNWAFEGGTPTGSNSANPGYVSYDTPGNYVTRLMISGSMGSVDKSYRYVSIYNPISSGTNLPYLQWSLDSLEGSRDEGGYTASVTVYQPAQDIEEGSVVVLFADDWYGSTRQTLGGNGENNSKIFFVGYVMDDSIRYDYEKSTVKFDIGSIARYMKEMDGFSVSVESHSAPTKWFQLYDLDINRAIYHYLRWHSTVLSTVDFELTNPAANNPKIQFFDADRSSLYDSVDNFARSTIVGKIVTDRQGKLWAERDITLSPTGTFPQIMGITNRDWMEEPAIDELMMNKTSYLEMGGISFSGIVTGTYAALMACAPGGAPSYRGGVERTQGLALTGQTQLNQIVQNLFAFKNNVVQSIEMPLTGKYTNLDIAPQEPVNIIVEPTDTVRRINIRNDFNVNAMAWEYNAKDSLLLPRVTWKPIVNGTHTESIVIPNVPDSNGFSIPPFNTPIPAFGNLNFNPNTATGTSCCDTLAGVTSVYCCTVIRNQLLLDLTHTINAPINLPFDRATNPNMYNPANPGVILGIAPTGTYTITMEADVVDASVNEPTYDVPVPTYISLVYNTATPIADYPAYTLQGFMGQNNHVSTSVTASLPGGVGATGFLFRVQRQDGFSVTVNAMWTNIKMTICKIT